MVDVYRTQISEDSHAQPVIPIHNLSGHVQGRKGVWIVGLSLASRSGIVGHLGFSSVPLLIPPAAEQAGFPH